MKKIGKKFGIPAFILTMFISGITNANESGNALNPSSNNDPDLAIENWMIDEIFWDEIETGNSETEISEPPMNIECWMVDENMWINAVPFMSQSSDKPITMEEWMTNSKYWANNVSK